MSLRERLPHLLSERIRVILPALQEQLASKLEQYQSKSEVIGREERSKHDIIDEIRKQLFTIMNTSAIEKKATPFLNSAK